MFKILFWSAVIAFALLHWEPVARRVHHLSVDLSNVSGSIESIHGLAN